MWIIRFSLLYKVSEFFAYGLGWPESSQEERSEVGEKKGSQS